MALDAAPQLRKKSNLAFKLETTTGTPVALAAGDGVTPVYNTQIRFQTEAVDRDSQGTSASPIAQDVGARAAEVQFESDFYGTGGATQPSWGVLFRACGMAVGGAPAQTYKPLTDAIETLTMGHYRAGKLRRASGCMGSFVMTVRRGRIPRIQWRFRGVQQPDTAVANIAPTYDATFGPRAGASVFTIGGTTLRVPEIQIDKGNQVELREDILGVDEAADATGYRAAMITGWKTLVSISPEGLPLGTKDWVNIFRTRTLVALSCTVGSAEGQKAVITAAKMQLITDPEDEDRNGLLADRLQFLCIRATDAGDDDLSIDIDQNP